MASGWDDTPPPPPPNDTARLNGEVRVTSATGGQKGRKNARLGGADPGALMELARVYGYGEEKYARFNYLKGYDWSLSIDALYRHFLAFQSGEDRDPESGLLHTAHVAWHALALTAFLQRGLGTDDRPKAESRVLKCECVVERGLGDCIGSAAEGSRFCADCIDDPDCPAA